MGPGMATRPNGPRVGGEGVGSPVRLAAGAPASATATTAVPAIGAATRNSATAHTYDQDHFHSFLVYIHPPPAGIPQAASDDRYALNGRRDVLGGLLRSSVADYEVIQVLPLTGAGQARYLCRPPERLGVNDPVMITELAVDAAGWRDLTSQLSRLAGVGTDRLLAMYEVGPDLDARAAGVYLVTEAAPGGSAADPTDPLDAAGRIRAVAEAARGAHALHEAGMVHGSVSGDSIFLTLRGAALGPPTFGRPPGEVARMRDWRSLVVLDPALLRGEEPCNVAARAQHVRRPGRLLPAQQGGVQQDETLPITHQGHLARRAAEGRRPEHRARGVRKMEPLLMDPCTMPASCRAWAPLAASATARIRAAWSKGSAGSAAVPPGAASRPDKPRPPGHRDRVRPRTA